jgi:hypothetical protein
MFLYNVDTTEVMRCSVSEAYEHVAPLLWFSKFQCCTLIISPRNTAAFLNKNEKTYATENTKARIFRMGMKLGLCR